MVLQPDVRTFWLPTEGLCDADKGTGAGGASGKAPRETVRLHAPHVLDDNEKTCWGDAR